MAEDNILYDDGEIKVTVFPKDPEAHEVFVKRTENTHLLQRGVLKDVVKSKTLESSCRKLHNSCPGLMEDITIKNPSEICKDLIYPLTRAYLAEVEKEKDYWIGEYNRTSCALDHATGPNRDVKGIMG